MAHLDRHGEVDSRPVVYPESDGEPSGETDEHITAILYLRQALRWLLRAVTDVYMAANMLFYFEEGDPTARRAPDVFAVKGIAKKDRRTHQLWEERISPCTVIEVTSRSSRLGTGSAEYPPGTAWVRGVASWPHLSPRPVSPV